MSDCINSKFLSVCLVKHSRTAIRRSHHKIAVFRLSVVALVII